MRSNREWMFWGKTDPLWAVNSVRGKKRGSPGAWCDGDFLGSGAAYFESVLPQWRGYGMGSGHCLEIGCGSGRITNQLLNVFKQVTALDVSPDQIESARRLLGAKADRAAFMLVDVPQVPLPDCSLDGMFSCEVFQHFDDFSGVESYLRAVFPKLKPGGTICFQIPVSGVHNISMPRYWLKRAVTAAERLAGRPAIMEYRLYPAPRIFQALGGAGYKDCEMRMFPVAFHEDGHAYFFARKAVR